MPELDARGPWSTRIKAMTAAALAATPIANGRTSPSTDNISTSLVIHGYLADEPALHLFLLKPRRQQLLPE